MHPLDNVIWQALTTRQAEFAESSGPARRFIPEISPLGGFAEPTAEGYESLATLVGTGGTIGLFLDMPYQPRAGWSFVAGAPCRKWFVRAPERRPRSAPPSQRSSNSAPRTGLT